MRSLNLNRFLATLLAAVCLGGLSVSATHAQSKFDRAQLIEAARKEGKLIFYSTIPEEQNNEILKRFQKKYPFIDVSSFRATSGRLGARLDAEIGAGKVHGDILQMGSFGRFLGYAKAGNFDRFETPEMDAYDAKFKDSGLWTVFRISPILIAYSSRLADKDAPTSWADLAAPKFKGKVAMLDATSGGQQAHWYQVRQYLGPGFWKQVSNNGAMALSGANRAIDSVLTGEFDVAGHTYGYVVNSYQKKNAPIKQVIPKEGVPIMISPIAVLKGGPNPNAGRLFVDWILSREGQIDTVDIMNDYSPRADAPAPKGLPEYKNLKILTPDSWDTLANSEKAFGSEWNELFAKKK